MVGFKFDVDLVDPVPVVVDNLLHVVDLPGLLFLVGGMFGLDDLLVNGGISDLICLACQPLIYDVGDVLGFLIIGGVVDQSLDFPGMGECEAGEEVPHWALWAELHEFLCILVCLLEASSTLYISLKMLFIMIVPGS